ncbi:gas vesicle protein [Micromonospora sp. NPDC051300]|uniref:gas vesicle protein n=1 Tax=Micromonospora sp. NPDC051300 TaxID=3364286 RepID=UPI00378DBF8E
MHAALAGHAVDADDTGRRTGDYRVLATGVVITGDITLAIADVDLVRISLRALVASVGALAPPDVTGMP